MDERRQNPFFRRRYNRPEPVYHRSRRIIEMRKHCRLTASIPITVARSENGKIGLAIKVEIACVSAVVVNSYADCLRVSNRRVGRAG
jgi:hypothetical protein